MAYLTREEWDRFAELFEKKEGTNYYDAKELAFQLLGWYPDVYDKARENEKKLGLTDLISLANKALAGTFDERERSR